MARTDIKRRLRERTFSRPTPELQTLPERDDLDAGDSRPLGQCVCLSHGGNDDVRATIIHLFFAGRPQAIIRRVPAGIVASFKRMLRRWPMSHVSQEVLVRTRPPRAHRQPSGAIVNEGLIMRIAATLFHAAPNRPLRGLIFHRLDAHFAFRVIAGAVRTVFVELTERLRPFTRRAGLRFGVWCVSHAGRAPLRGACGQTGRVWLHSSGRSAFYPSLPLLQFGNSS